MRRSERRLTETERIAGAEPMELRTLLSVSPILGSDQQEVRLLIGLRYGDTTSWDRDVLESVKFDHSTAYDRTGRINRSVFSLVATGLSPPASTTENSILGDAYLTDIADRSGLTPENAPEPPVASDPVQPTPGPMGPFLPHDAGENIHGPLAPEGPVREAETTPDTTIEIEVKVEVIDPKGVLTAKDLEQIEANVQHFVHVITGYAPKQARLTLRFRHLRNTERPVAKPTEPAIAGKQTRPASRTEPAVGEPPRAKKAPSVTSQPPAGPADFASPTNPETETRNTEAQPTTSHPATPPQQDADAVFATGDLSFLDEYDFTNKPNVDSRPDRPASDSKTKTAADDEQPLIHVPENPAAPVQSVTEAAKPEATVLPPDKVGSSEQQTSAQHRFVSALTAEATTQPQSERLPPEPSELSGSLRFLEHSQAPRGPPDNQTIGSAFRLNHVGRLRLQMLRHNVAPRSPSVVLAL